jgi:signal transduction histidine kinase
MVAAARRQRDRLVRQLLLRTVSLFVALFVAELSIVGWLFFHDFNERAIQQKLLEAHDLGAWLADRFAGELAPAGSIDLVRLEERRDALERILDQAVEQIRFVNTVQVVTREGRVLLDIRRTASGRVRFIYWGLPFGGAAPRGPDSPPLDALPADPPAAGPPVALGRVIELPMGRAGDSLVLGVNSRALEAVAEEMHAENLVKLAVGGAVSLALLAVAFLYVLRLIHRTRRLEADAQRAEQLAHLGTLASGLAHEIRNPLNAMNINLQMLEEEIVAGEVGDDTLALLRSSRAEVLRLERLVKDFLAYARPRQLRKADVAPLDLVDDVVRFVRPQFEGAEVALELERDETAPVVRVDAEQIRQALLNILQNALEVSAPGKRVSVQVGATEQGEAVVTVRDQGAGIPDDVRARIFEVFWSKKPAGSGLGLPIAQRAVESHGGRIEVASALGLGSTFRIVLPPAVATEPGEASAVGVPAAG